MREIDRRAMEASKSGDTLRLFIQAYEAYILKCASKTSKRYITKSDDEWSIALEAFCSAVEAYAYEKGSFLRFAEMVINRRLIDYFRRQSKFGAEFSVDPYAFYGDPDENETDFSIASEIASKTKVITDNSLKDEILAVANQLCAYGFSFFDLIQSSPKSKKTKETCYLTIHYLISNPILISELRRTKNLPLKTIEKNMKVPRKILERHRKYIIAAVEILTGDYPGLSEYLQSFRKEPNK